MSEALGRIAAARRILTTLPLLPAQEEELRFAATVGTVHYSTLIEGNALSELEAERAARGTLERNTKAQLELINYVETLRWLDEQQAGETIAYSKAFICEMHRRLTRGLGRSDDMFKPHHEGAYRDGIAIVPDELGAPIHQGAPPDEVRGLMDALFGFLADRRTTPIEYPGAVLAGLAHHRITDVHPFADGNGRVARTFAIAVLMREGLLPERIFSFERHYAERKDDYFAALRSVTRHMPNHTVWLEYYLGGLAVEYDRVAARVTEINQATTIAADRARLSTRQEQLISKLSGAPQTSGELAQQLGISVRAATAELSKLIRFGVVRRRSLGRERLYQLAAGPTSRAGRREEWTDDRIAAELSNVIADLGHRPSMVEVRAANSALLSAIRRRGGLREWLRRVSPR